MAADQKERAEMRSELFAKLAETEKIYDDLVDFGLPGGIGSREDIFDQAWHNFVSASEDVRIFYPYEYTKLIESGLSCQEFINQLSDIY